MKNFLEKQLQNKNIIANTFRRDKKPGHALKIKMF